MRSGCSLRAMSNADDYDPPRLPVSDAAWNDAAEISGEEWWLTTEPDLHLLGMNKGGSAHG